ncbi:MAG: ACT domain-containing protein [Anaerolineae bacterium]|nr:ACT domain-containing protein [Anaerolineae bacterium]
MMTAEQALTQSTLYTDEVDYTLIHLPPGAITPAAVVFAAISDPFGALIADKDEVTLLLAQDDWEAYKHRLPDHTTTGPYRLITFDLELEPDLIGFMALIARILAEANVSILAFSAYARDHIFVQSNQFQTAWDALTTAQRESGK